MTAALGRRRPAVPVHPLAAVPAATCARQAPSLPMFRGRGSNVVHVLEQALPLCRIRVRRLDRWTGSPALRLCSLCASAVAGRHLGPFWKPSRAELAEVHLHAADHLVADVRERLADIRSAAIHDGSALIPVEQLPTYRTSRAVPDSEPVPSLRTAVILGQLLDRLAPATTVPTAAEQARADAAAAARQASTDRLVAATQERRLDLRAARAAKKRPR